MDSIRIPDTPAELLAGAVRTQVRGHAEEPAPPMRLASYPVVLRRAGDLRRTRWLAAAVIVLAGCLAVALTYAAAARRSAAQWEAAATRAEDARQEAQHARAALLLERAALRAVLAGLLASAERPGPGRG